MFRRGTRRTDFLQADYPEIILAKIRESDLIDWCAHLRRLRQAKEARRRQRGKLEAGS